MIEGINILNMIEVTNFPMWCLVVVCVGIVMIILGLTIAIDSASSEINIFCFGVALIILGVFCCLVGDKVRVKLTYVDYIKYEVTINEDMNFKEFNDKYEILEQRGYIYVIKERED